MSVVSALLKETPKSFLAPLACEDTVRKFLL